MVVLKMGRDTHCNVALQVVGKTDQKTSDEGRHSVGGLVPALNIPQRCGAVSGAASMAKDTSSSFVVTQELRAVSFPRHCVACDYIDVDGWPNHEGGLSKKKKITAHRFSQAHQSLSGLETFSLSTAPIACKCYKFSQNRFLWCGKQCAMVRKNVQ